MEHARNLHCRDSFVAPLCIPEGLADSAEPLDMSGLQISDILEQATHDL